jgi:ATP-dependent helicase HrpB
LTPPFSEARPLPAAQPLPTAQPLPIESALPELRAALTRARSAVLTAPPGSGKTTIVPPALLAESWLSGRRILVLEPRRIAARAAAHRMAFLAGGEVGGLIGYRTRHENRVGRDTRIEVVTEGILTRRLQSDPGLEGIGLVVFDELHERHLQTDLGLALTLGARAALRDDLHILVMSATLDARPVAALIQGEIVSATGAMHPVEVSYAARDPERPIPETAAAGIVRALAETRGDVLAFLPGGGEIQRAARILESEEDVRDTVLMPLFGDLPREEQDRALSPDPRGRRKIVLATSIAESSLTIEGVRVVVDAGWMRAPRFDPATGMTRLDTIRVSKASADQRAGRAGRLGPGVCYRLWSEATHHGLAAATAPEILSADLVPLALELAAWGARDAKTLKWIDPPPAAALEQARQILGRLGAIDSSGAIIARGREMARLAMHPRLARMVLAGREAGRERLALELAAILSERDMFRPDPGGGRTINLVERVELLRGRKGAAGRAEPSLGVLDRGGREAVARTLRLWTRGGRSSACEEAVDDREAGLLLSFAYPDRIAAERAPGTGRYQLSNGRGARLPDGQKLLHGEILVAAHLDGRGRESVIHLAAPVAIEALERAAPELLAHRERVAWNGQTESVVAVRETLVGDAVLLSTPILEPDSSTVLDALVEGLRRIGLGALPWSDAARELRERVLFLREQCPEDGWPDWTDTGLLGALEEWLGHHLEGMTKRADWSRLELEAILEGLLPWNLRRRLDDEAPTHLEVPSGSRVRIDYATGEPVLAVKLQEMFGLAETPRIARGRVPVLLHLLSPARRPIQVTRDLRGFWDRTYAEVKKELKGRYPRHPWPENPWNATPTRRAKPR